ncbi:MFS transporter [Secundilactobacillus collinoides]|uniref:MFS transporter n=1 Tax=Secundilactobacillus collinoides TaxID=33960 RepID=UPI000AACF350|nr:MFS transporter [Secundilactobacillus collinoides]
MQSKNAISKKTQMVAWIIVFGAMAPMLDTTMINIALNSLRLSFHSSLTTVQWTVTCYLLATGVAVPFSSWLLNKFDGKKNSLFSVRHYSALVPYWLPSPQTFIFLIAMRLVQGFADGLITPLLINLIVQLSGPEVLGQLMATVGLPIILGPLLGPVVGGVIIKFLSWHWIFWINVPITIMSVILIACKMPQFPPKDKQSKMDFVGIGLLVLLSSTVIYGVVEAGTKDTFLNRETVDFFALWVRDGHCLCCVGNRAA